MIPDFTSEAHEDIINWADAKVEFDDTFVGSDGKETHYPEMACWYLSHKWGSWALGYRVDQEKKARMHAALFLFLWYKGVGLPLSDELASFYVEKTNS